MEIADHIITYTNEQRRHGIYAGENNVIYFDHEKTHAILVESLDNFCQQKGCYILNYPFRPFARAFSLERAYRLMTEHSPSAFQSDEQFVAWCIKGEFFREDPQYQDKSQETDTVRRTIKTIVSHAVDSLTRNPVLKQQAERINPYLPVIIGSIQVGIEVKKILDAKKK